MLLLLDDEHKDHLSFLRSASTDVAREFCRIAVEFLHKEANPKTYQSAAQKLGVAASSVQNAVEGLMHLFTEAAKLMISEVDFHDSVMTLGLNEDICEVVKEVFSAHKTEIRSLLSSLSLQVPSYENLHWRLDVKLASRSVRYQTDPCILLQLQTREGSDIATSVLQTDPVNLLHLTRSLETALQQLQSPHCRRILRNI